MKVETKYERKGNVIRNVGTNKVEVFKSINLAKKESRDRQLPNGGLGAGFVQVVRHETNHSPSASGKKRKKR